MQDFSGSSFRFLLISRQRPKKNACAPLQASQRMLFLKKCEISPNQKITSIVGGKGVSQAKCIWIWIQFPAADNLKSSILPGMTTDSQFTSVSSYLFDPLSESTNIVSLLIWKDCKNGKMFVFVQFRKKCQRQPIFGYSQCYQIWPKARHFYLRYRSETQATKSDLKPDIFILDIYRSETQEYLVIVLSKVYMIHLRFVSSGVTNYVISNGYLNSPDHKNVSFVFSRIGHQVISSKLERNLFVCRESRQTKHTGFWSKMSKHIYAGSEKQIFKFRSKKLKQIELGRESRTMSEGVKQSRRLFWWVEEVETNQVWSRKSKDTKIGSRKSKHTKI